jgi:hypothetical protein
VEALHSLKIKVGALHGQGPCAAAPSQAADGSIDRLHGNPFFPPISGTQYPPPARVGIEVRPGFLVFSVRSVFYPHDSSLVLFFIGFCFEDNFQI